MFNSAFDELGDAAADFYPPAFCAEIDRINPLVYENVNNGEYRCGFAGTQEAYNEAFNVLFRTLGELETRLSRQRFLGGQRITEADWRLFTTLVRFDPVYCVHFKCNLYHIADYFMELYAEALPNSGDRRDRQHRADQTPITMPVTTVPIRAGSSRAGRPSISARRTIAIASSLEARISADAD
jgi:hypothetical protein